VRNPFNPQDWFAKARQDVRTVEILLREGGDAEVAGFHLSQAVEWRYQ
jgi:HEPN domain-containing protein